MLYLALKIDLLTKSLLEHLVLLLQLLPLREILLDILSLLFLSCSVLPDLISASSPFS